MPTVSWGKSGAITFARSVIFMLGIFGTKISPPCIISSDDKTNSTPCSFVIRIAHVTKEIAHAIVLGLVEFLGHLVLLEFVAGEHNELARLETP